MKKQVVMLSIGLAILLVAGLALPASGSAPLDGAAMAAWVGGGSPWCAFGLGLATGLGIAGALAVVGGATAPVGAGLTVAGAVVGGITYLAC